MNSQKWTTTRPAATFTPNTPGSSPQTPDADAVATALAAAWLSRTLCCGKVLPCLTRLSQGGRALCEPERTEERTPEPPKTPDGLLRLKDAARYLQISDRCLWTLGQQGRIPVVRIGRCLRFRRKDLDEFIDNAVQKTG